MTKKTIVHLILIILVSFVISYFLFERSQLSALNKELTEYTDYFDFLFKDEDTVKITFLDNDMKLDGLNYSAFLKVGPNTYLDGIKANGKSLKYVEKTENGYRVIELPFKKIPRIFDNKTLLVTVDGEVVYSNKLENISLTLEKIHGVKKIRSSEFGFDIVFITAPILSTFFVTNIYGTGVTIFIILFTVIVIRKNKEFEESIRVLNMNVMDMASKVETGENVHFSILPTKNKILLEVESGLKDLFERYTEAIEGYKTTTQQLEDSLAHLEEIQSTIEERNFLLINTLAETVELKDVGTGQHSRRVMTLALALAQRLGIKDPEELGAIKYGAILHDIGKVGIPEEILLKPSKLSKEEFEIMKQHTLLGEKVVSQVPGWELVADIVRHHHENIDGTGYPDGLTKDEISKRAQIVAIVDVYAALTEERPYRRGMTKEEALNLMKTLVGTKFAPEIFEEFVKLVEGEFSEYE